MTRSEFVQAISARVPHLKPEDIDLMVRTVFAAMTEALVRDDRIEIRGFGSFTARRRRARQGRNPKTGAVVNVPEKRVPFFVAGQDLAARVDGSNRRKPLPPKSHEDETLRESNLERATRLELATLSLGISPPHQ
jgi:integration host factor subunit beta